MKNISLLFILIFSGISAFGQRGFYATDSTMSVGVKIIDNGRIDNSHWCEVKKGKRILIFSPDEIVLYGFNKGRIYRSKKITYSGSSDNYFLEQLSEGELTLFYFADKNYSTFYIEKDSTSFFELPKGKENDNSCYQKQLQKITSAFPEMHNNAMLVRYNRRALSRFINEYNNQIYKPFPYFKIGPVGFTEMSKFLIPKKASLAKLDPIIFQYDKSFGAGIFTDIPFVASNFSLHMEYLFTQHSYSFSTETTNGIVDFAANISSVKVPILLRYTYPSKRVSPFFNAGGTLACNINKKEKFLETIFSENIIAIEDITDKSLIPGFQKGISAGLGIEYRLNYNHSLFFEVRLNRTLDDNKTLHSQDIQLLVGFNI